MPQQTELIKETCKTFETSVHQNCKSFENDFGVTARALFDRDMRLVTCNQQFMTLLTYSKNSLEGIKGMLNLYRDDAIPMQGQVCKHSNKKKGLYMDIGITVLIEFSAVRQILNSDYPMIRFSDNGIFKGVIGVDEQAVPIYDVRTLLKKNVDLENTDPGTDSHTSRCSFTTILLLQDCNGLFGCLVNKLLDIVDYVPMQKKSKDCISHEKEDRELEIASFTQDSGRNYASVLSCQYLRQHIAKNESMLNSN
ncbi:hypothetical protein MTsDn1_25250 [Alteromonas sp. MTD1]|uniref:hypothetical protein n=1 Tax=Alteromonas sp. MTD1 TaxID=3057962 RepID=UPI0036F1AA18